MQILKTDNVTWLTCGTITSQDAIAEIRTCPNVATNTVRLIDNERGNEVVVTMNIGELEIYTFSGEYMLLTLPILHCD